MVHYRPTPVIALTSAILTRHDITVLVKREDLNHHHVSGNKWWKLKHNLQFALDQKIGTIVTFGGAFSNHLYSTAAACKELGLKSIGVVRGEKITPLNETLSFCEQQDMKLVFVSRSDYRKKTEQGFLKNLQLADESIYLIPEGGSNKNGFKGCIELAAELSDINFTHLILPVGTGCTMAGLMAGLPGKKIVGVSVLKNGDFLKQQIISQLNGMNPGCCGSMTLLTSYDHGGYASVTEDLMKFIGEMETENLLPLDPVYTGKAMYALMKEVEKGNFERGSTILFLHTGGLQGRSGFKSS